MRKLTLSEKLSCMTANRNALQEEVQGLHLVINQLRGHLGLKPLFKDLPLNTQMQLDKKPNKVIEDRQAKPCPYCVSFADGGSLSNFCSNCGKAFYR